MLWSGMAIVLGAGSASGQTPAAAKAAVVFSTAAQAADTITTLRASDWRQREANVLVPRSSTGLIVAKATAATVNAALSSRAARKHPKLVFWTQIVLGSGMTCVAWHNHRQR